METYRSPITSGKRNPNGFTMIEVLIAMSVLAVGLCSMALLTAQTLSGTERARYMSLAATLTSEKLEDLNRWTSVDPHVAAGGSLTSDSSTGAYNYYDDVDLSNVSGQVSETFSSTSGGSTTYTTVIHNSTGVVTPASNTPAPTGAGIITFHRRWFIEANPVVNGITVTGPRRITVLTTLTAGSVRPGAAPTFQASLVRP
jgi:prepilin-type N-terminal cleavage/methylation domain-containing protein